MRRVGGGTQCSTQCSKLVSLGLQLAEALVGASAPMDLLAKAGALSCMLAWASALSSVILASASNVLAGPVPISTHSSVKRVGSKLEV